MICLVNGMQYIVVAGGAREHPADPVALSFLSTRSYFGEAKSQVGRLLPRVSADGRHRIFNLPAGSYDV